MAIIIALVISLFTIPAKKPDLQNNRFEIYVAKDHSWIIKEKSTRRTWAFRPDFVVLTAKADPKMAMRPAGIENVMYNVVTWEAEDLAAEDQLRQERIGKEVGGDGFDDRILKGKTGLRTPDVFKAGHREPLEASKHRIKGGEVTFSFHTPKAFTFSASLFFKGNNAFPTLRYVITAHDENFYSVGYTGAPAYPIEEATAIWQPMVWQEKRFPEKSFLTLAYQCPIPATLVSTSGGCTGVVADPDEFPFQPLPLLDNSRFGIALRNEEGKAQSMLFAPALGGTESLLKSNMAFSFDLQLYASTGKLSDAFEEIAQDIYGFGDYRKNATCTLNETLDNMVDYGMSAYSMFVDSLKGCAYSTDVPGAVKNVSALDPLQMALLTDREDIYWTRAYPIMEFLLSREKFLFTLDSMQKIQNPSRKMRGPVAPVSELAALYRISGGKSQALLDLANHEFSKNRIRNLSVEERGDTWQNALALYQATGEKRYLDKAITGADKYMAERVNKPSEDFNTVEKGFFFWNGFTPDWINLLQLYEATGNAKYLDGAHQGARQYTTFAWYTPRIPDESIVVNEGNKAPMYWYLKSKGHLPMTVPEETVPAWRVSEIGLTPESSGTCAGHRGIFMANYAPWMLKIGYLTNDDFLKQTAKAAVIGRYENFPGYHMNTARTTAYEKADYPLRPFKELSVNSFHFNHIWPHMSILVDYLFTEAFVKSDGRISMPASFIEGYAYLQSRFYGHAPGEFYGERNVYPWMPSALLTTTSNQLNYVAFRGNNSVYLVFLNQSPEKVLSQVTLNKALFAPMDAGEYHGQVWTDNKSNGTLRMTNGRFSVTVNPNAITAVKLEGLEAKVGFQEQFHKSTHGASPGLISLAAGSARAMVLDFGKNLRTLYVYLQEDDRTVKSATLQYAIDGKQFTVQDHDYPFEFTVALPEEAKRSALKLSVTKTDGAIVTEDIPLQGKE